MNNIRKIKQTEMHWQQRNVFVRFENKRIEDTKSQAKGAQTA